MLTQGEVLELIAKQSERGKATSVTEVAEEFDLDEIAASGHLRRLWRERLIEAVHPRPPRFKFRLTPGERLRDLRFRIAPRGKERLEWMEDQKDRF